MSLPMKFISLFVLIGISLNIHAGTCPYEAGLASLNSNHGAKITFINRSASEEDSYKIYWLDFQGNRKLYTTLYRGDRWSVNTFLSHPWLVTAPVPGGGEDCIQIYMPDPGQRTVVFN